MASENKMQFISAGSSYSDLEGEIGKPVATVNKSANVSSKTNEGGATATIQMSQSEFRPELISTLDEPVLTTINRDLKAVAYKFGHVFFPKQSQMLLRDWDLWGPLSLCVLLSISLQANNNSNKNDDAPQFASIFALITFGSIVVTINTKLLSGKISFFQSICVLGYCLLPLVLVSILNDTIMFVTSHSNSFILFSVHFVFVCLACGWSVFASTAFLAADTINLNDRKALAIYPIFLFYFVISWLIILDRS
jgi:hypothetical protein